MKYQMAMFLFRDGLLTLIYNASLKVLMTHPLEKCYMYAQDIIEKHRNQSAERKSSIKNSIPW